jgi:hypothetical protein
LAVMTPGCPASFFAPFRGRAMSVWCVVNRYRKKHHSKVLVVKIK